MKKRKIIATVGPSTFNEQIIKKMDEVGVDMFRINLSHTVVEEFSSIVKKLSSWTSKPICPDTEGAQLRTAINGDKIEVLTNDEIEIVNKGELNNNQLAFNTFDVKKILHVGDLLKIDFDGVLVSIIQVSKNKIIGRVISGGNIGNNKGVAIDRDIILPSFTKKDLEIISLSKDLQLDTIFFSFCSNHKDIKILREMFDYPVSIICKIESKGGLSDLANICKESNGVLIDRGDLSREVPLEKIPFAQTYIIDQARASNTEVFVATNLMENMIENSKPTRAEINDIRSTLLEGVDGLVLAAESAIGKYPVDCVRIMSRIIHEVDSNNKCTLEYLTSLPSARMIEPHGGKLIQQHITTSLKSLPSEKLIVDENCYMDSFQIAEGTYSPIKKFMDVKELESVLNNNTLLNNIPWPMPILFQTDKNVVSSLPIKGDVLLYRENNNFPFAILKIKNIEKLYEKKKIAKLWFGTDDDKHPGVHNFFTKGDYIISGEPFLLSTYENKDKNGYELRPKQTREIFDHNGWHKVIGFHTRNVIHRGHEHIQLESLRNYNADAIFISPVTGVKKKGDFRSEIILTCYTELIKRDTYSPFGALLGSFNTYSRFSGPREAVFTALCRKNYGCSHFIVGRDHTGVGNYYGKTSAQEIFDKIDTGIKIIKTDEIGYDNKAKKYVSKNDCNNNLKELSGSNIRELLLGNNELPEYLIRPHIATLLKNLLQKTPDRLFEH